VQDYNLPVLSLVTLPNLVLAALEAIPEGARTAESAPEDGPRLEFDEADEDAYEENAENAENEDDGDAEEAFRPFDPTRAGTLDVTPELLDAFKALLEEHNVELLFTYGDWSGMAAQLAEQEGYNLVLTAETIYAEETVQPLVDVLRAATRAGFESNSKATQQTTGNLEDSLGALSVADEWAKHPLATSDPVILVAAKVSPLYTVLLGYGRILTPPSRSSTLASAVASTRSSRSCACSGGGARAYRTGSRALGGPSSASGGSGLLGLLARGCRCCTNRTGDMMHRT
jgi:protein-histidine N-methyltransferase